MAQSPEQDGIHQKTMSGIDKLAEWSLYTHDKSIDAGYNCQIEVNPMGFILRLHKRTNNQAIKVLAVQKQISFLEFDIIDLQGLIYRTNKLFAEIELAYIKLENDAFKSVQDGPVGNTFG